MPGTSTPLTPAQTVAALKKFGVPYREVAGWKTRNRSVANPYWGPVYGFMVHHTGDDAPDSADRNVIVQGRSDLPGPLAQFGGNDDGVIDLIGNGRANHAGTGDPDVLNAVKNESYSSYPPKPNQKTVDGNRHFYGLETYYSGKSRPKQYASMVNLAAAICDAHGWTAKSVIGHKEWSYTKPDPGSVDMAQFRKDVDARIAAVNGKKPTTPTPAPVPQKEIDMQPTDKVTYNNAGPKGGTETITVASALARGSYAYDAILGDGWLIGRLNTAMQQSAAAMAKNKVLEEAIKAVQAGGGIDLAELDKKIAASVDASIAELRIVGPSDLEPTITPTPTA